MDWLDSTGEVQVVRENKTLLGLPGEAVDPLNRPLLATPVLTMEGIIEYDDTIGEILFALYFGKEEGQGESATISTTKSIR